jgi:hypothetical protein
MTVFGETVVRRRPDIARLPDLPIIVWNRLVVDEAGDPDRRTGRKDGRSSALAPKRRVSIDAGYRGCSIRRQNTYGSWLGPYRCIS